VSRKKKEMRIVQIVASSERILVRSEQRLKNGEANVESGEHIGDSCQPSQQLAISNYHLKGQCHEIF